MTYFWAACTGIHIGSIKEDSSICNYAEDSSICIYASPNEAYTYPQQEYAIPVQKGTQPVQERHTASTAARKAQNQYKNKATEIDCALKYLFSTVLH